MPYVDAVTASPRSQPYDRVIGVRSLVRFISRGLQAFRKVGEPSVEAPGRGYLDAAGPVGRLSRPRPQRHYFNFGTRPAAELATPKLANEGFSVELADIPDTGQWLL